MNRYASSELDKPRTRGRILGDLVAFSFVFVIGWGTLGNVLGRWLGNEELGSWLGIGAGFISGTLAAAKLSVEKWRNRMFPLLLAVFAGFALGMISAMTGFVLNLKYVPSQPDVDFFGIGFITGMVLGTGLGLLPDSCAFVVPGFWFGGLAGWVFGLVVLVLVLLCHMGGQGDVSLNSDHGLFQLSASDSIVMMRVIMIGAMCLGCFFGVVYGMKWSPEPSQSCVVPDKVTELLPDVPCPQCGQPLATPRAKQCFECGADCHLS